MEENREKTIRVLHIISKFNVGGIETWLLNVTKNLPDSGYHFDFFVISPGEAALNNKIISLGSKIFEGSKPQPTTFSIYTDLKKVIQKNGPYNVIHSHVHYFSGISLSVGYFLGIPIRIAHSHTDSRIKEKSKGLLRQLYIWLMKILIRLFATRGIAVSSLAAEDLFGSDWDKSKRWAILPCGIDFERFNVPKDASLALSLGVPAGAKVVGHAGRFDHPKNHSFLVEIFKKLLDRGNNVILLLIGDGNLEKAIKDKVALLGISDRVIFLGVRQDVPNLLISVVDVFLFPSLYEGLPLAFIEAQLAGCYCLGSSVLPKESVLDTKNVALLSLNDPLEVWAKKIEGFLLFPNDRDPHKVISQYYGSDYEMKINVKKLLDFYLNSEER